MEEAFLDEEQKLDYDEEDPAAIIQLDQDENLLDDMDKMVETAFVLPDISFVAEKKIAQLQIAENNSEGDENIGDKDEDD